MSWEATGLCHSDEHVRTGDLPAPLPLVGGHEGAGIVQEVGHGVVGLAPGDHVVASFLPACGRCRFCSTGHQNLCDLGAMIMAGTQLDGTYRRRVRGQDVGVMALVGTFSQYGTVPEASVVKIDDDLPLSRGLPAGLWRHHRVGFGREHRRRCARRRRRGGRAAVASAAEPSRGRGWRVRRRSSWWTWLKPSAPTRFSSALPTSPRRCPRRPRWSPN